MRYALGVGSNLGDRHGWLDRAWELLGRRVSCLQSSSRIETAPVGGPPQGDYINAVWIVEGPENALEMLRIAQEVETACERLRTVRWGPRTLDLDCLLSDPATIADLPELTLPHPRLHLRDFVLHPLKEVAGDWWHPVLKVRIQDIHVGSVQ